MKAKRITEITALLICISLILCSCGTAKNENTVMKLSNPNANAQTVAVYDYICDIYGKQIITAQQESIWVDGPDYEMNYILDSTGKLPAMRGLDFMNDDFDGVVERSIDWWNRGGLVTICWHCGADFTGNYDSCKNDEITDWNAVLTEGTEENKKFIANMDNAGKALQKLQENGVTVLWRPFHEFDGQWFWWGKGDAENFKKLWIMMYDRFTNDLELNNLIWVLGYSHNGKEYKGNPAKWYPGDEYCDIVGADSYEVDENGAEERLHKIVQKITNGTKPLIFHECGKIPTVEQFKETQWCSFMTWHTEWLIDTNTRDELNEIYNSEYAITLDELPNFSNLTKEENNMGNMVKNLQEKITDKMSITDIVKIFEQESQPMNEEDLILFETGTYNFTGEELFYFSLVKQFPNDDDEYYQIHINILYEPDSENKKFHSNAWSDSIKGDIFDYIRDSKEFAYAKNNEYAKFEIYMDET